MHITDAKIDLNGRAIADGTIQFPPSKNNIFIAPDTNNLVLDFEQGMCRIQAASVHRDDTTGFFTPEPTGPTLHLPVPISQTLQRALRYSQSGPVTTTVNNHSGFLRLGTASQECWDQRLSNWKIVAERRNGHLKVKVFADLHDLTPANDKWAIAHQPIQYWHKNDTATEKLQVNFTVDLMTRELLFDSSELIYGTHKPSPSSDKLTELDQFNDDKTALNLRNTMITTLGDLICIGDRHPFVKVSRSSNNLYPSIAISRLASVKLNEFGFVVEGREIDPRVVLKCISLDQVSKILQFTNAYTVKYENGNFGRVAPVGAERWDYESGYTPDRQIRKAYLKFSLVKGGLRVEYDLSCSSLHIVGHIRGWYKDAFTIPWEALVIHYPIIGKKLNQFTN